ncbi:MAG: radical SAM protein, partial [bacterium]
MRTAAFYTLGCKVNQYETELIREQFLAQNYKIVPFSNLADVYVINTCTVTAKSDRKCRYYIQAALRSSPPRGKVIVTGCYVNSAPTELAKISPRIIIIPNQEKKNIVKHLLKDAVSPEISFINTFKGHARAFVKIQDGCDAFCAYCIVPYVRNILISRPSGEILSEVHNLVKNGYKEIVLTGIRLGKFRMTKEGSRPAPSQQTLAGKSVGRQARGGKEKSDLVELIKLIHQIQGLERIRLSSIEPVDVTDELIEAMASLPKLCHHLHIPLQSGDDEVL